MQLEVSSGTGGLPAPHLDVPLEVKDGLLDNISERYTAFVVVATTTTTVQSTLVQHQSLVRIVLTRVTDERVEHLSDRERY